MRKFVAILAFALIFSLVFVRAHEVEVLDDVEEDSTPSSDVSEFLAPEPNGPVVFFDNFNEDFQNRWKAMSSSKYTGTWKWATPETLVGIAGDRGLLVSDAGRHHAIVAVIEPPVDNTDKDLIVQYEVKLQNPLQCSGAYIKLLAAKTLDLENFNDATPYVIMFGPDKCGVSDKVHFIFRHQNPKTKEWEEKHLQNPPAIKNDRKTHLYTLVVRKDQTFEIRIDNEKVSEGSLLESFVPAVNPPKMIDDPSDSKPEDWVDQAEIADPEATKPDDWDEEAPREIVDTEDTKPEDWLDDEPLEIADPEAEKPEDWDDEEDGMWEASLVPNPKCEEHGCGEWKPRMMSNPEYKGKWRAPMIANPAYKGPWKARQIENPNYFEDSTPSNFPRIGGIGIEILANQNKQLFDNILITHDDSVARDYAEKTWAVKFAAEKAQEPEPTKKSSASELGVLGPYLEKFMEFVVENPLPAGATLIVVLLSIPLLCLRGGKKPRREEESELVPSEPAQPQQEQPESQPEEVSKEEQPAVPSDEEPPKSPSTASASKPVKRKPQRAD